MTRRRILAACVAAVALVGAAPAWALGPSQTLEQKLLEWVFKSAGGAAFGTPPTQLWFSLHSADPGDTCASELAGTGSYARAQLNPDTNNVTNAQYNALDQSAAASRITNNDDITFPTASAPWNGGSPILYFGVRDASTAGTCLWTGQIAGGTGVVVLSGSTLKFTGGAPGQMSATLD